MNPDSPKPLLVTWLSLSVVVFGIVVTFNATSAESGTSQRSMDPALEKQIVEASRKVVRQFGSSLKAELVAALSSGGPVEAVQVCSTKAPEIAARHSAHPGWTVRRTSSKTRNPVHRPDEWERQALLRLSSGTSGSELHEWTTAQDGTQTLRYLRAIRVMPKCLTCHGDRSSFSEDLAASLQQKYPDDQATGYDVGDFRGAFSVTVEWPAGREALDEILAAVSETDSN